MNQTWFKNVLLSQIEFLRKYKWSVSVSACLSVLVSLCKDDINAHPIPPKLYWFEFVLQATAHSFSIHLEKCGKSLVQLYICGTGKNVRIGNFPFKHQLWPVFGHMFSKIPKSSNFVIKLLNENKINWNNYKFLRHPQLLPVAFYRKILR